MSDERLIPEGKVWRFVFEVSHAPQYAIQHDNGSFSAIYPPVEYPEEDTAVPMGLSRETVLERSSQDHVEVTVVDRENSPWADGVFLEND